MKDLRKDIEEHFIEPPIIKVNLSLSLLKNFKGIITDHKKEMLLRAINSIEYNKITNVSQINLELLSKYRDDLNFDDSGYNETIHTINKIISDKHVKICLDNCVSEYLLIRNPEIYQSLEHSDNLRIVCNKINIPFKNEYRSHMKGNSISCSATVTFIITVIAIIDIVITSIFIF